MTPVKAKRITLTRRLVQAAMLLLILYGAFVWTKPVESELFPAIPSGTPRTTQYERNRILWVSGKESVVDLYLPVLACRPLAECGALRPRPVEYWPVDILELAEALLVPGRR